MTYLSSLTSFLLNDDLLWFASQLYYIIMCSLLKSDVLSVRLRNKQSLQIVFCLVDHCFSFLLGCWVRFCRRGGWSIRTPNERNQPGYGLLMLYSLLRRSCCMNVFLGHFNCLWLSTYLSLCIFISLSLSCLLSVCLSLLLCICLCFSLSLSEFSLCFMFVGWDSLYCIN